MPKRPRNFAIAFGAETLTQYGGGYLQHRFLSRIGFKNAVPMDVRVVQRNTRYSVGEMPVALLYPTILGLEWIEMPQRLRQNGVFQYFTGLHTYSESVHAAAILPAYGADGAPPTADAARSLPVADDCATTRTIAAEFRSGRHLSVYGQGAPPTTARPF